jgi:hypothetical protein
MAHCPPAHPAPAARRLQPQVHIYCSLWLLFFSAMGVTGLAHQLGWLLKSGQPLYVVREYRGERVRQLKEKALELASAAEEENWDLLATRKRFYAEQPPHRTHRPHPFEAMHVLFLEGRQGELAAAVVFHRDATKREQGFLLVTRQEPYEIKSMTELPRILERYASQ